MGRKIYFLLDDPGFKSSYNFWLPKPYGLANQKLCYIQVLLNIEKNLENKTKNVLENGWWIRILVNKNILCLFLQDLSIWI